jgi:integrase
MKITKSVVEHAEAPQSGQKFIRDDELKGFALRVTASGARSFVWEGRVKGRMRRVTVGSFPALTVLAARQKALAAKAAVIDGKDPSEERRSEHHEMTFSALATRYVTEHAKPHKRSWKEDERRIKAHLLPRFGTRRLSDMRPDEIVGMQNVLRRERGLYESNRVAVLLRTMFNIARDMKLFAGENPAARIKLFHENQRERFLSPEELRRVNEALVQEPNKYWRAYFPLSLLLGTRKSELLAVRWADIDFEQLTLRLPMTKAGRSHLLPLPIPAAELLGSLSSCGQSEWVFPSKTGDGHTVEAAKAWHRIRARAGVPDVRLHDLRRTLGSWLAAQGHSLPLIGRALNHSSMAATQIYARIDLDPVRHALEENAKLMLGNMRNAAASSSDFEESGRRARGFSD